MNGIKNFLYFVNNNYVTILVCIGLIIGIVKKTILYLSKSKKEQVRIAKAQIKQIIYKLVASAELDYKDWNKSGAIKRSQVISEIYKQYPILARVVEQKELAEFIDYQIDKALDNINSVNKKDI